MPLCLARGFKKTKKENVPESTSCKRSLKTHAVDMGKKVVKRARVEIEPLQVKRQVSWCSVTWSCFSLLIFNYSQTSPKRTPLGPSIAVRLQEVEKSKHHRGYGVIVMPSNH